MPRRRALVLTAAFALCPGPTLAQRTGADPPDVPTSEVPSQDPQETEDQRMLEVKGRRPEPGPKGRAADTVTRSDVEEMQPRSVPDALRAVPGVSVQQTSHGQASPYVRGVTGQRVLSLFDGFRLNHTLYRQGPNQYLFTVDRHTLDRARVVRGSASVQLGADAIGGAILLTPREPRLDPGAEGVIWHPRARLRHATQDAEIGGRLESDVQLAPDTALLAGIGWRDTDELEAAGPIRGPKGKEPQSPCFEVDGRTVCVDREGTPPQDAGNRRIQTGTGFSELTADARLVHRLDEANRLTAAAYVYRQFDAPRTDRCPPPEATAEECMIYEEQFRTHVYGKARLTPEVPGAERLTLGLGFQRYHEKRKLERPLSFTVIGGRDDVDMLDFFAHGETAARRVARWAVLRADWGLNATREEVTSKAWIIFTSSLTGEESVFPQSRGVYMDGSGALQAGAFAAPTLTLFDRLTLRGGARVALARAHSPADEDSSSAEVDARWSAAVAEAGVEWAVYGPLTLLASAEQGFRPPNLDDLTARQATGRGYQLENPSLGPERSLTLETGLRLQFRRLAVEGWVFRMTLDDAMERRRADCPAGNLECAGNRAPTQVVNTPGTAVIEGLEASAEVKVPGGFQLRGHLAWAEGETDNPLRGLAAQGGEKRTPLSRVPPLNGAVDLAWHEESAARGPYLGATWTMAAAQEELSYGDSVDARIPPGGTPGFQRLDLRGGLRVPDRFALSMVFENVLDEPYRIHGSGINGPGRGLILQVEVMQ